MQKTCNLGKLKVVRGSYSATYGFHYRTILYDGPNVVAEYDSNGNLLKSYIHAPGIDNPLAEVDHTGAEPEWHYYLKDGQGSISAITEADALAAVVAKYDYTAFGSLIPETSSPAPEADGQPTANFMYTGREYNPESGDYYFRWRSYSPTYGRFSGADPSGYTDGWNLYGSYFAGNGTDPMGLAWLEAKDAITYPFFKGTLYEEPGEELRYLTLNVGEESIPWIESGTIWKKHIWVPTEVEARLALKDPTMYKLYLLWVNTNIMRGTGETIRSTLHLYPQKIGAGRQLQHYDPLPGYYVSPGSTAQAMVRPFAEFGAGVGEGFSESAVTGISAPPALTPHEQLGQTVGRAAGLIYAASGM